MSIFTKCSLIFSSVGKSPTAGRASKTFFAAKAITKSFVANFSCDLKRSNQITYKYHSILWQLCATACLTSAISIK